jgi:hypothetical protein
MRRALLGAQKGMTAMNPTLTYDGCLEQWKINLALSRIRAFDFPKDQWPDLLQRLALAIAQFQFDPNNGAKESTALYTLINHQLNSVRRAQMREEQRLARHRSCTVIRSIAQKERTDLQLDVRLAVAALPAMERSVCDGLMRGNTVNQIASDLGYTWHAVRRLMARVQERFSQIGLDEWVGD